MTTTPNRDWVSIAEAIERLVSRWEETDPVKIVERDLAEAEDRLFRARRQLEAEPDEPVRWVKVIQLEAEVRALRRIAGRIGGPQREAA